MLDGLSATKLIREQEKEMGLSPVPIIALTAGAMVGALVGPVRSWADPGKVFYLCLRTKMSLSPTQAGGLALAPPQRAAPSGDNCISLVLRP